MGHLMERYGMMMAPARPGTCTECAVAHDPDMPHNKDSLYYKYKFFDQHGRWPSWMDAMAHCSEEVKAFWQQALKEKGVDLEQRAETETINISVTVE